jgi:hypothetical protein
MYECVCECVCVCFSERERECVYVRALMYAGVWAQSALFLTLEGT